MTSITADIESLSIHAASPPTKASKMSPHPHEDRLRKVEIDQMTHEAVCAERYRGIIETTSAIKEDFKSMSGTLLKIGYMLLLGMGGIIVKLSINH